MESLGKKNCFVVAVNLNTGGGKEILTNFLLFPPKNVRFFVAIKEGELPVGMKVASNIEIVKIESKSLKYLGLLAFYLFQVEHLRKLYDCDVVLSLGNFASRVKCWQTLYLHWPYVLDDYLEILTRMSLRESALRVLKRRLVIYFFRYTNVCIVQSHVFRDQLYKKRIFEKRIEVVYPGCSSGDIKPSNAIVLGLPNRSGQVGVIYPCLHYPHKNLEFLPQVIDAVRLAGVDVKLYLTLSESTFQSLKLDRYPEIVNLGFLDRPTLLKAYFEADCLFFPSLKETFGLPLLEALSLGLPILCSDLPIFREICESDAIYFDQSSASSIASAFVCFRAIRDNSCNRRFEKPVSSLKKFTTWENSFKSILDVSV